MRIKYSKFNVGEKVKVRGLYAVVEGISYENNEFQYQLLGLPFNFTESELQK